MNRQVIFLSPISDDELIHMLCTQPEKGLEVLMDQYMGLVYKIVQSKFNGMFSKEDIEECVCDIFLELFNNHEKIDLSRGTIKAYICVIAKRRAYDFYRRQGKHCGFATLDSIEDLASPFSTENDVIRQQEKLELINAIHSLGGTDSEIFIRKYFFGQSSKEISSQLHIRKNTIDKKISRGILKLRKILRVVK